jgi:hypothetical protein
MVRKTHTRTTLTVIFHWLRASPDQTTQTGKAFSIERDGDGNVFRPGELLLGGSKLSQFTPKMW